MLPFTFHRYTGEVPGLIGFAWNVTDDPAQTGFAEVLMVILTDMFGLTVIVIVLEVAGFPLAQTALEVRIQVTRSPDTGVYV
jgi:hypothetical protein